MEFENKNMANKNRDINKNWREIFEDALWIAQKLGLSSANKLQERLRELGLPTTVQKQETSKEAESKKDGSIEMGDFDRGASISRDDEVIFSKIKVDLVETVHLDRGFAGSDKVRPLESTPMLNLHTFRSKEIQTSVGSVKKRKEKEAAGGKEKEKVGITNPTLIPPNPETQPNPKALSHNSSPNQFQYKPNFSFHKSNPTQLSFFINHPINQTKIYDPGPRIFCTFTHSISNSFSTSLTHNLHFKKTTSQPKILLHKISNLKTQNPTEISLGNCCPSHKIFPNRTFFSPHFFPFSTSTSTATLQPLHSSLHHPPISSYPFNIHNSSSPNNVTTNIDLDVENFFTLLRLSVQYGDVSLAKAVHASIVKIQEEEHTRLGNPLISAYVKLGLAVDAYKVFTGLSNPNVVSFTSLVSGFAKSGREEEAIELFLRMRDEGIEPNEHSFVAILTACIRLLELNFGSQVHGLIVKMGYLDNVFVANALMGLYGKFGGLLEYVVKVFDEMSQRDIASWNTVISSVVKELKYEKAFELFRDMKRNDDFRVDYITISTLLTALTGSFSLMEGRSLHAHAIRIGLECNLSVNNGLIGFYTKCGSVKDVEAIFERMPIRDVITWTEMVIAYMEFGLVDSAVETFDMMPEKNCISYNALLAGFCKNSRGMRAIDFFVKMVEEGLVLTDFTLTSVINACGSLAEVKLSEQIHVFVLKFGFGSNACIEAALLDMMTRCGRMADAEKMFHQWPSYQESSIIWTSMLCGYARNGQPEHAISLFHRSQSEGMMVVDEVAVTSVLGVCGTLGFHEMGKQIHCHALKTGFSFDVGVGNSIISMYFKCCNMSDATKAFHVMPSHDIVSWNGLIAGHLLYRQGDEALNIWSRMENASIKPDAVTFVLVISAYRCTKLNLVDSCRKLFHSMETIYNIEPTSDHYASLVSVLGCWGFHDEAEEIINKMPFEPNVSVWRALLDSCRTHKNTTIGKRVAKHILTMEPQDPSAYVLISNLYSASGRWHNSEIIREDMREKGFRKHPSRSWIIHQNKVHSFYTRDKSHPQEKDIYSALDILILECFKAGYVPDTRYVLHEVEEHQKKDFLFYHSAKLAATFGLLKTQHREPIRIVKNILVCGDCHMFLKYVSAVTRREIFLRDASGFHHFSDGQCSCKDFW